MNKTMIKNNMIRKFAALLTGCAVFAVSCQKQEEDSGKVQVNDPVFPSKVEKTVKAGETVSLSFSADMDWEVSVPESTLQWFWLEDGTFKLPKISGKASSSVTVIVGVSDTEEFDQNRSVEVKLSMGDRSEVIAVITRPAKDKTLSVYAAKVVDGEIQFTEDGSSYDYEAEDADRLELVWTGSDFRLPIKVESNYDWTIRTPSWASLDVPTEAVGVRTLNLYGVPSEYPLENEEGKLQFMSGDVVVKEYVIAIPGCEDIFSYKVDKSITELEFNYAGNYKVATGFIEGPAGGYVFGTEGVSVLALTGNGDTYLADSPSWLKIEVAAYDGSEGADVLQERYFSISAYVNEGENRYAAVFFLPPAVSAAASDLLDGGEVRQEYVQYMLPVVQLSSDQEYVSMISNASETAAAGATFNISEDEELYTMFGQSRYAYELVYTNQYARDKAWMMFTSAATSYSIYDEELADRTGAEDFFLSFTMDEDNLGGVVDMVSETKATGYVVLYGSSENVLAVIRCVMDPEEVIGEVEDVAFIGESIDDAKTYGATLENVIDDPAFSHYREGNALVYHLKYTTADKPMRISIPASVKKHTVNPYVNRHCFSVNGTKYDEDFVGGVLGGVAITDGGVTISMTMPEGKDYLRGNMIFSNSSDETVLVLVCTFDLSASR